MSVPDPPPRVRVTSPRTAATRARRSLPASEIDRRTRLGEVYVSSLMRAQLRLALGVLAVVGGLVAGLPVAFRLFPALRETVLLNMPLPWVLLAFAVYPFLFGCGWFYLRRAERNERVFQALVDPTADWEDAP